MNRFLLLTLTCLLLNGCAQGDWSSMSAQGNVNKEQAAWGLLATKVQKACVEKGVKLDQTLKSGNKTKSLNILTCVDELRNKIVAPAAAFPDLYAKMDADRVASKNDYANGKIGIDEFLVQANLRKAVYWRQVQSRAKRGTHAKSQARN